MVLEGFEEEAFTWKEETRTVYRLGTGPGVIVMHEVPGITPEVERFARRVAQDGFTVKMPLLFGTPGRGYDPVSTASAIVRACIGREFHVLAARGSSPITVWLRALCRATHAELGGAGVGAVGMCLTGNFALALMVDEAVMAPVLSQPSLPFGVTPGRNRELHLSDADLDVVRRRANAGAGVLGLRFTHDFMCPGARFETLRRELGDGFEGIEIDSGPGNPHGLSRTAHSVLTRDLVDKEGHPTQQALRRVLDLFCARLKPKRDT